MQKNEALQQLEQLIEQINSLQARERLSESFKKWQHDVIASIKYIFPNDDTYQQDFRNISFFVGHAPAKEYDKQEAYIRGLSSARAFLQSKVDEITKFWPATEQASQADPGINSENSSLVFVIHGRQYLTEFHAFLRAIGLKPLEWSQARNGTKKTNPYTWEVVDYALRKAGAIVALFTADDEARLRENLWSANESGLEKEYLGQPRQNVLFEAGVAYGRSPERTVLIRVGSHRPMSDLAGHHILQLSDSPESRQAIADALQNAGCPVDLSGSDWFRAGSFSLR
jgi:predicted nucleotide-binding protein